MNDQVIRSFISIELPDELKAGLFQLQAELRLAGNTFIKWVAPEGIHLTLKFLGNIIPQKVTEVIEAMEEVSHGSAPFQLETGELGAFPNLRRPRVFWLGIYGDLNRLAALQKRIDDALITLGFPEEKRNFSPHITLARIGAKASVQDQRDFGELIAKTPFEFKYKIDVHGLNLMRSQLLPAGAIYTRLAEVMLKNFS